MKNEEEDKSMFMKDSIRNNDQNKSSSFRIDDILLSTQNFQKFSTKNTDSSMKNSSNKFPIFDMPNFFQKISLPTNRPEFLPLFYHGKRILIEKL